MSGVLLMACLHGQRNSARVGRRPPLHEPRVARQGEAGGDRRRGGRGGEGRARRSELIVRMTLWNYTSLTDSASWGLPLLRSLRPFKYLSGNQPATHLCEKDPSGRQPVVDDIGTGRVLASGAVMDAVRDAPLGFEPLEEVTLQGIPEPVPLYRVTRGETARR